MRRALPPKHECPDCGTRHWTPAQLKEILEKWDRCAECGELVWADYQLKNEVWVLTGLPLGEGGGVLHLECVEKRIGRSLTAEDFTPAAGINQIIRWAMSRENHEH